MGKNRRKAMGIHKSIQSFGISLIKRLCGTATRITRKELERIGSNGKGSLAHRQEASRRREMATNMHN
jgi:hypothetical protein